MKVSFATPHPALTPSAYPAIAAVQGWLAQAPVAGPPRAARDVEALCRGNGLLAALPAALTVRWAAQADCVTLHAGQTLHAPGEPLRWVYFPLTALVSLSVADRAGAAAELAVVGREGVVGLPPLEGDRARSRAVVQSPGTALRLRATLLAEAFAGEAAVHRLLLAYSQALVAEIMQGALCSRHHSLEQQVARLILQRADRQPRQALAMTHEAMAAMLGVRRESVTTAAARLQQAGCIRYARGRIAVLARPDLEARACECYGAIRHEFERAMRPCAAC